jgi:hypothetical protein
MRPRWFVGMVFAVAWLSAVHGQSGFDGKWQGQTVAGRHVALDLKVAGSRLTGTFMLDKQTVPIADGKVAERTCSFRIALEGRMPSASGELTRDRITLSLEGVPNPVLLQRVKLK